MTARRRRNAILGMSLLLPLLLACGIFGDTPTPAPSPQPQTAEENGELMSVPTPLTTPRAAPPTIAEPATATSDEIPPTASATIEEQAAPSVTPMEDGQSEIVPILQDLSIDSEGILLLPAPAIYAGDLVTDITADQLAAAPRDESVSVACDGHETVGIFTTDHNEPDATLLALIGESGCLELAIVGISISAMLGIRVGAKVVVKW